MLFQVVALLSLPFY